MKVREDRITAYAEREIIRRKTRVGVNLRKRLGRSARKTAQDKRERLRGLKAGESTQPVHRLLPPDLRVPFSDTTLRVGCLNVGELGSKESRIEKHLVNRAYDAIGLQELRVPSDWAAKTAFAKKSIKRFPEAFKRGLYTMLNPLLEDVHEIPCNELHIQAVTFSKGGRPSFSLTITHHRGTRTSRWRIPTKLSDS